MAFWHNDAAQGLSSTIRNSAHIYEESQRKTSVRSIDWPRLTAEHGVPYYCKIDIEGGEQDFLSSIGGAPLLPTYMSVEAHRFEPIEALYALGYRKFKLIDQTILHSFAVPKPALEGAYVARPNWTHASGPFGRELMGERWLDFPEVAEVFALAMRLRSYRTIYWSWLDCHAWRPTPACEEIRCVIDVVDGCDVAGWALRPADPSQPVEMLACVDGPGVARVRCDGDRPDVERAGLGSARAGFRVSLSPGGEPPWRLEFRDSLGNIVPIWQQGQRRLFLDLSGSGSY